MRRLIPILFVIAACNNDNRSPAENAALIVCDNYCNACDQEEDRERGCAQICFDQWALHGGSANVEKQDCATGLLIGRECQTERGCSAPGCGTPWTDMRRCIDLLRDESTPSE